MSYLLFDCFSFGVEAYYISTSKQLFLTPLPGANLYPPLLSSPVLGEENGRIIGPVSLYHLSPIITKNYIGAELELLTFNLDVLSRPYFSHLGLFLATRKVILFECKENLFLARC